MTLVARLYILRELYILIRGAMGDLVRKIGADPQKDLNCPSLAELLDLLIHRWSHPMQCSWKKASVEYQSVAIVKLEAWSNVGKLSTQSSLSLCHLITLWKVEIKQWALERNSKEGLHLKWFQHPVE